MCIRDRPQILEKAGQLDILHANAGSYVGGDLVDVDPDAIDRMLNLNINVVMKNVHDVLPHMIERRSGDIIVTSSLAAHFPTPWEPVYASSKWAINAFVQIVRRQVFKYGIRVGSISPGPVITLSLIHIYLLNPALTGFAGLENYSFLFDDPTLWTSL